MTLPDADVIDFISSRFILSHKNIQKERHVGLSHGYRPSQSAVGTTNGAGGRNVQFLVLAADETVVHALPGFWHAEDLIHELQLALDLHRLYRADNMSERRKQQMFAMLHATHLRRHGPDERRRGQWQDFDRWREVERAQTEERDTFRRAADGSLELRPLVDVVHERLLARRFRKLEDFDLEGFVDYGRPFYDNNHQDKGRDFSRAWRENQKRETAKRKAKEKAAREAARAARRRKGGRKAATAIRP
ncbi:MAG TPA: hypothetical protein ENI87_03125 [bacterium]|nr:hypothetical protein [bacterium]